jgi:hypothetical protein
MATHIIACASLAAILGGIVYLEFAVWAECLDKNSFFFCMRVIK